MFKRMSVLTLLALSIALPASAEYTTAKEKVRVSASAGTFSRALALTKESALEKFGGSYFQSRTGARNYKLILPYLRPLESVLLEDYRELRQQRDAQTGQLVLEAEYGVKVQELTRQLDLILGRVEALRQEQRILVLIEEGLDRSEPSVSALQPPLEQHLIDRGYHLLDPDSFTAAKTQQEEILTAIAADDPAWRQSARALGADWVIRISSDIDSQLRDQQVSNGKIVKPGYFEARAILNAEVLDVQTGRKRAFHQLQLNDRANQRDEVYRLLSRRGAVEMGLLLHDSLLDILLAQSRPQSEERLRVLLSGVKSYQREVRPFIQILQGLVGVDSVEEVSFGEERLELEVRHHLTRLQLEQLLLEHALEVGALSRIDKHSSGRNISHFVLTAPGKTAAATLDPSAEENEESLVHPEQPTADKADASAALQP